MNSPKLRLAQIEVVPGAPRTNLQQMLQIVAQAEQEQVDLLIFPALALSGVLVGRLWRTPDFIHECEACGDELRAAARRLVLIFGNVACDWQERNHDGTLRLYNALFAAEAGQWLPPLGRERPYLVAGGYSEPAWRAAAAEWRHGGPAELSALIATRRAGLLGLLPGALAMPPEVAAAEARNLAAAGAGMLITTGPTPFCRDGAAQQAEACRTLAAAAARPLAYINQVGVEDGGKTIHLLAGGSNLYTAAGAHLTPLPPFSSGLLKCHLPSEAAVTAAAETESEVATITCGLLYGAQQFMQRSRIKRLVIGLSGGIDSALSAALYGRLLPPEDLLLLSLPGPYTSATTRRLAAQQAANLGCRFAEVPIDAAVALTQAQFAALRPSEIPGVPPLTLALTPRALENVQARDRGARILAAAAAAFGGVVACNANKSELTIGYSTLYGDIIGWLALLGDLWKGDIYAVARYLNREIYRREVIPQGCFEIVPSAELSATQAVERREGDPLHYPYHDALFRAWTERPLPPAPAELLAHYRRGTLAAELGFAGTVEALFPDAAACEADLQQWWQLYTGLARAKRLQAPPVMALSAYPFGVE